MKEVECIICKTMVSKRKSLAFGIGRACRTHKQVIEHCEKVRKEAEDVRVGQEIDEMMRVLSLAAYVRVQHSIYGSPPEGIYYRLERTDGKSLAEKVRQEVDKQGGPYVDPAELISGALYVAGLGK